MPCRLGVTLLLAAMCLLSRVHVCVRAQDAAPSMQTGTLAGMDASATTTVNMVHNMEQAQHGEETVVDNTEAAGTDGDTHFNDDDERDSSYPGFFAHIDTCQKQVNVTQCYVNNALKAWRDGEWQLSLDIISGGKMHHYMALDDDSVVLPGAVLDTDQFIRTSEFLFRRFRSKSCRLLMAKSDTDVNTEFVFKFHQTARCLGTLAEQSLRAKNWRQAYRYLVTARSRARVAQRGEWTRQIDALSQLMTLVQSNEPLPEMQFEPVDVRENLSIQDFWREYAEPRKPVVFKDVFDKMGISSWDLEFFRTTCTNMTVTPKYIPGKLGTENWGGLATHPDMSLGSFIDDLLAGGTMATAYVHDEGLPGSCDEALQTYRMPKYFANDFFHRMPMTVKDENLTTPEGGPVYEWMIGPAPNWPSLFIGGKHTRSLLHKDSRKTQFWMPMIRGRKRWTIFPESEDPLLGVDDVRYKVDGIAPDYDKFPLSRFIKGWRHLLQPGEVMYIPTAAPHQVENLDDITIALAGNFMDNHSMADTIDDIRRRAALNVHDKNDAAMGFFFNSEDFNRTMIEYEDHVPWAVFNNASVENNIAWRQEYPTLDAQFEDFMVQVVLEMRRAGRMKDDDEDDDAHDDGDDGDDDNKENDS